VAVRPPASLTRCLLRICAKRGHGCVSVQSWAVLPVSRATALLRSQLRPCWKCISKALGIPLKSLISLPVSFSPLRGGNGMAGPQPGLLKVHCLQRLAVPPVPRQLGHGAPPVGVGFIRQVFPVTQGARRTFILRRLPWHPVVWILLRSFLRFRVHLLRRTSLRLLILTRGGTRQSLGASFGHLSLSTFLRW